MESPEFFHGGFYRSGTAGGGNHQFPQEKLHAEDHFIIDDLLDFSNEDAVIEDAALFDNFAGNSTDSSTVSIIDRCNSSFSGTDPHFSSDVPCRSYPDAQFSEELCVPYDDLAQLEWLSTFEEESFSSEDLQKLQLISGMKARPESESETREHQSVAIRNNTNFTQEIITSVPGKARSKRSRAAPCNWSSRLLVLSPTTSSSESDPTAALNCSGKKTTSKGAMKKKESPENSTSGNGEGRKCLHCATDKTPQWRTGPMGPKTLCNACGVRYKSGRLVPEYRPAASPTFVLTQHSNSHRKVLELRRQKEMQTQLHQQPYVHGNGMFNVSSSNGEDYLIHHHHHHQHHHHGGHDFRQLI